MWPRGGDLRADTAQQGLDVRPFLYAGAWPTSPPACGARKRAFDDTVVRSYVSLSFADTDEAPLTSNVTFRTPLPDVLPYISDRESVKDAAGGKFPA